MVNLVTSPVDSLPPSGLISLMKSWLSLPKKRIQVIVFIPGQCGYEIGFACLARTKYACAHFFRDEALAQRLKDLLARLSSFRRPSFSLRTTSSFLPTQLPASSQAFAKLSQYSESSISFSRLFAQKRYRYPSRNLHCVVMSEVSFRGFFQKEFLHFYQ